MKKINKIGLVLIFSFLFVFLSINFCFGQKELEVSYPGVEAPTTVRTPLSAYIKYIFNLAVMLAGLVAFGALIYGGFRYLTSAGNPAVMGDAKDQIFAGILGLIIIFASYLILTTINPQLVIISPKKATLDQGIILKNEEEITYTLSVANLGGFAPDSFEILSSLENLDVFFYSEENYDEDGTKVKVEDKSGTFPYQGVTPKSIELRWKPYGIYLCKTSAKKECVVYQSSSATLAEEIDNKIGYIYFKLPGGVGYTVVLHEDQNYQGECKVINSTGDGAVDEIGGVLSLGEVSSIEIFHQSQSNKCPDEGVTLYEAFEYNKECNTETENCYKICNNPLGKELPPCGDDCVGFASGPGHCWGPFKSSPSSFDSKHDVRSVEINPSGKCLAVLFTSSGGGGKCEAFRISDPILKDNDIGITHIKTLIILPIK